MWGVRGNISEKRFPGIEGGVDKGQGLVPNYRWGIIRARFGRLDVKFIPIPLVAKDAIRVAPVGAPEEAG